MFTFLSPGAKADRQAAFDWNWRVICSLYWPLWIRHYSLGSGWVKQTISKQTHTGAHTLSESHVQLLINFQEISISLLFIFSSTQPPSSFFFALLEIVSWVNCIAIEFCNLISLDTWRHTLSCLPSFCGRPSVSTMASTTFPLSLFNMQILFFFLFASFEEHN